jgi:uncharacterized protein YkwD
MTPKLLRRYVFVLVAGVLLAVALSTGRGPATAAAASATGDCAPASSWPAANGSLASQVLTLINQHRAAMGLRQLVSSPSLSASAVWKARHMAAYNYMAHDDPAPPAARSAANRIATCGYPNAGWGENIAFGYSTAQSVVNAWLASSGHKANIENGSFVSTGIGAAQSAANGIAWAQDFGTVADGGSPPATTTAPPPPPPPPATTAQTTTTARTTTTAPTTTAPAPQTTTASSNPPAKTAAAAPAPTAIALASPGVRVKLHRLSLVTRVVLGAKPEQAAHVDVKCSATAGGRQLRVVVNAFGGQAARCVWRVPASMHRKLVHGWIRVQLSGVHVRRPFAVALP